MKVAKALRVIVPEADRPAERGFEGRRVALMKNNNLYSSQPWGKQQSQQ